MEGGELGRFETGTRFPSLSLHLLMIRHVQVFTWLQGLTRATSHNQGCPKLGPAEVKGTISSKFCVVSLNICSCRCFNHSLLPLPQQHDLAVSSDEGRGAVTGLGRALHPSSVTGMQESPPASGQGTEAVHPVSSTRDTRTRVRMEPESTHGLCRETFVGGLPWLW